LLRDGLCPPLELGQQLVHEPGVTVEASEDPELTGDAKPFV
jgi:hypothetical protein